MREERKNSVRNSVARMAVSVLGFIIQTLYIIALFIKTNQYSVYFELITVIISVVLVLRINYDDRLNNNMKITWIILIVAFPVLGVVLYVMYGRRGSVGLAKRRHSRIRSRVLELKELYDDSEVYEELKAKDIWAANQVNYIRKFGDYPVYRCRNFRYFSDTNEALAEQIEMVNKARRFVFLEYHAIEDSTAFHMLLEPLAKKVAEGVEVRIIYDDVGSIGFLNSAFIRKMKELGIKCRVFNYVLPVLNIFMQNRDHRKIMVVDNEVAFTGGYNLADEYFGFTHPYGEWKDSGIEFDGEAVKVMTALFLYLWNIIEDSDSLKGVRSYFLDEATGRPLPSSESIYMTGGKRRPGYNGYIVPYGGNPLANERIPENVYLNIIKNSARYLYIMTPYLVLSTEMQKELELAAKRGVDVRIVTPGIPDKKTIFKVTRSYYHSLHNSGVKIYEYTPGFCHAKMIVADDKYAVVGTINFDFRSLYYHFENAVLMYDVPAIKDVRDDILDAVKVSSSVAEKFFTGSKMYYGLRHTILRLISPLL
ncbi:MAG: phospholipase D-like domain-containing protein [Clostridiales bacterium]|nr:phospholipase D-like domain-containing protein [Clostridiales bacterium]